MANPDRPQGFRPYGDVILAIPVVLGATAYPGDFLHLESDGLADPAVAGEDIYGLCLQYGVANDTVMMSASPNQIYIGQGDGSDINVQTDIGNLCDILATAGNTTYNLSRQEVDTSTIGTGSGGQLVILGVDGRVGNSLGAQVEVLVKINENQAFGETDFAGI